MQKLLRRLFSDLRAGENIDLYVTVIAAVVIAAWNLFCTPDSRVLSSTILAMLGLIAIGLLMNRDRLERVLKAQGQEAEDVLQTDFPNLENELEKSDEIWISGQNLRRTVISFITLFKKRKSRTVHVFGFFWSTPMGMQLSLRQND